MNEIKNLLDKEVLVEITGKTYFTGILVDIGLDILVIYNGQQFLYIPIMHMHNIKLNLEPEITSDVPEETPIQKSIDSSLSYRKILNNAKGRFLEIFVTGNRSIHGYITSVTNDYIAFYSPVYKTVLISMQHLKWFTPYSSQLTPYTLSNESLPVVPSMIPLARSFDEQLQKYKGKLVVFDLGDDPCKVGLLKEINNNIIHLINATGESIFWKQYHLKTVHLP
ncbi:MAG TPA: DUF2642 domain-containing protein [Bacillales bacterium]|nr:DUF2642 domain-containing protein [Bacillales bacterium]